MTLMQRLVAGLEVRGERHVEAATMRYVVFTRNRGGFYYVGHAGALRVGRTATGSRPVNDKFREQLLQIGEQALLAGHKLKAIRGD
jgi:hypothetical protein